MVPAAERLSRRYAELTMPVALIAGDGDQIVDPATHSLRLHREISHSDLVLEPATGHMAHYADPQRIMAVVGKLEKDAAPA
jgi:pimeloyl-ACP methyl ester carboxylesterase